MDESERWIKSLGRQSSVKDRWPHAQGKPSESPKPGDQRRSSSSSSQDGSSSERSHRHASSRTGEISGRVGAGSKTVVPQVETTQSITRPRTSPQVQQIPQSTPVHVSPAPPAEAQPSTKRPFIGGKHSTTQSPVQVSISYMQPSKPKSVVFNSKGPSSSHTEGHQTSEGVSTHHASPTPTIPPHLVQGPPLSTTVPGAQESLAIVSMSEVPGQGREEDWLVVNEGDVEGVPTHQQQVPEARTESGTDPQAAKKKVEEYRKQRDAARVEIRTLKQELALSQVDVEREGTKVAHYERRIRELEDMVSNMNAEHEAHIKQLRQEFESILAQKDEGSREAVARARKYGGDPNASGQQQLEAAYQDQIRQKERVFHEKEREFQRKQQHYLAQIAQLEDTHKEAKTREGGLRVQMEKMKMDYQSQLQKLCGSMTDSSLDEDSRCPSNPIVCQPSSTDAESKVLTGGAEHSSVKLQHLQRILSREQIDIDPAELASLGARERRTVQRKVQQLQNEVGLRDIDIETLSNQLELKEKRITALTRTIEQTRKTTERGLRHQNEDSYLDQLTELTGQLSTFEVSDRAQKNELAKLHVKVREAEEVAGQLDGAIERMSDLETENQALKEHVKLQKQAVAEATAQQSGGEVTYQSYNREVMAELKRLQPLEAEVQHLRKELSEAQEFHKDAIKLQTHVIDLTTQVSRREKEVADLLSEKSQLEAKIVALAPKDVVVSLREQLLAKEEELARFKSERVDKTGGQKAPGYAEEVTRLKRQLEIKEKDISKMKSQLASLAGPGKPTPTPKPRTRDTATEQTTDGPPPLDPPTNVVELQTLLQEKEAMIGRMSQQLQKFEKTATDLTKLVEHTKTQSVIVKELRQQLARVEGQSQLKMEKDDLSVAKDSIQDEISRLQKSCTGKETALIATQQENSRLKRQVDVLREEVDLLRGEKEQLEGRCSQLDSHLRRLQATMHQDAAKVSSEQGQRIALTVAKLDEVVKERNHLEQKTIALQAKFENTNQELARSRVEGTKLNAEVEYLRREKEVVLGELEAHKFTAQTFQEDFEQERKDREKAHSQVVEIEERYQHQLQSMVTQLNLTSQDLQKHKETLATTETLLHSQIEQLSDRLSEKDRQLATIANENDHLQEEVLSKTQQVKQYKKQVDQYKEEVGAHKHVAEIQMKQVEKFAKESEEWESRAAEWQASYDAMEAEVRRERSRREAFERKIADMEKLNDQLQDRPSFPSKAESQALSRVKASPPMHRAHSSNEASGYNSHHARTTPLQKGRSVDNDAMLNPRGTSSSSQQTRAAADNRASTLPAHTKQGTGSPHPQSALAQTYHPGDAFNKPPALPPRAPPGFRGVPSTKPSVSATSHTPSPGIGVSGVPSTRPSIPATSYGHTSPPYSDGGRSSNVPATRPPAIHHTVPPAMVGSYYYDHQGQIPRASTHPDASGYHPQQQQPSQPQRGTAPPYRANLHPGYSAVSPSSLPPMSTISGDAESFRRHAYDDSSVHAGHHPDYVERDSPPSSNISGQSSQPPDASQQMPQYSGRGGSRQRQQQQPSYGVTAGGGNSQASYLPSRFSPPGGHAYTNAPQPPQQPYRPPHSGTAYPMPHNAPAGQYPTPRSQLGYHGTNTSPNVLETPQSGPAPRTHSANVRRPVQETHQGPSGQPKPSSQAAYTTPNISQPGRGMESNRLDVGIEREIYHVAKDVMKSDSEAPQTLGDEEVPYDPNLICPKCHLGFRIGEIQKYRRHVKTCTVGGK